MFPSAPLRRPPEKAVPWLNAGKQLSPYSRDRTASPPVASRHGKGYGYPQQTGGTHRLSACQRTSSGRYRRSLHSALGAVRSLTPLLLRKPLGFHPNPRQGFHPCTLTRTSSPGPFFFDCLTGGTHRLFSFPYSFRHPAPPRLPPKTRAVFYVHPRQIVVS